MSTWLELGVFAILTAATAVGMAEALRQAPLVRRWNEDGVKPWACDLCMTFWLTLVVVLLAVVVRGEMQWIGAWMPAFAVAYSWLTRVTPAPPASGDFGGIPGEPPTVSPGAGPSTDDHGDSE